MGFYFRKSISFGPLRFNLSRSGLGASIGVKGARLTATATGKTYVTVGSQGFYYRQALGKSPASSGRPKASFNWRDAAEDKGDIHTAHVEDLTESTASELVEQLNKRARISSFPGWLLIAGSILALVALLAGRQTDLNSTTADQESGASQSPDLAVSSYLFNTRGEKLPVASLKGQVLVLNFWKKDCKACPRQFVLWNRVNSLFRADNKVIFLRVSSDTEPTVRHYPTPAANSYSGRDLAGVFGVSRVPTIILLNENGRENSRIVGLGPGFEAGLRDGILAAKFSSRMPPPAEAEMVVAPTTVSVNKAALGTLSASFLAGGVFLLYRVRQKRHTLILYELDIVKGREFAQVQRAFEKLAGADCVWRVTSRVSVVR